MNMRRTTTLLQRLALLAGLSALLATTPGCPEVALGGPGDRCNSGDGCRGGLCYGSVCLDPLGDEDQDGLVNSREGQLGTDPLLKDSDGDGEGDFAEVGASAAPADGDGDGKIDALESSLAGADPDRDCLPDEFDPHNLEPDIDEGRLVVVWCVRGGGVCDTERDRVTAVCRRELAGVSEAVACDYSEVESYEAVESRCDELDNDCNGETDDQLANVEDVGGTVRCPLQGVCHGFDGVPRATCEGGSWSCDFAHLPGFEAKNERSCDGLDNDCDGETDEDFRYEELGDVLALGDTCGLGLCAGGVVECADDQSGYACSTAGRAEEEVCDDLDDDCDGFTDEGFELGGIEIGGRCGGQGGCDELSGLVECSASGEAMCSIDFGGSEYGGSDEVCDAIDNDCDGETDEDPVPADGSAPPCPLFGVCRGVAIVVCGADGEPLCDYAAVDDYEATEVTCDGLDNDCDGRADDRLPKDFAGDVAVVDPGLPPDRWGYAAAAAADRGAVVLVGGVAVGPNPVLTLEAMAVDTWELDTATGRWSRYATLPSEPKPPARDGAQLVYDAAGARMLLVGGRDRTADGVAAHRDLWAYDLETHTWSDLTPAGGIPGRSRASAVLVDGADDTRYLFLLGGEPTDEDGVDAADYVFASRVSLGETLTVTPSPLALPPVMDATAAWDTGTDRILLFGGVDTGGTASSDTRVIAWNDGAPALATGDTVGGVTPSAQSDATLARDPETGAVVLYGLRSVGGSAVPSTWRLAAAAAAGGAYDWSWQPFAQTPELQPPIRASAVLAADRGKVHLWLGLSPEGLLRHDSWSVDLAVNLWAPNLQGVRAFPPPRRFAASAVSREQRRWYVYGGATATPGGFAIRRDLWVYDIDEKSWTNLLPFALPGSVPEVAGAAAILDEARGRLILIAGTRVIDGEIAIAGGMAKMWTLDLTSFAWTETDTSAVGGPPGLYGHTAVLTPDGQAVLVYGGYAAGFPSPALWRLELATDTWSVVIPAGTAPQARAGHFAVLDEADDTMLVFGGVGADGSVARYTFIDNTWTETAGGTEANRAIALGAYDPQTKQAVLLSLDESTPSDIAWSRLDVSAAAPQRLGYDEASVLPAMIWAPTIYDFANRGALILGATDQVDRLAGGLWRLPQVCR